MNQILINQNKTENIDKLSAQRNLYSKAKKIQLWQIVLSIFVTILISILALINPFFDEISTIYGTVMLVMSFIFTVIIQNIKEQAAKTQELFDCEVLDLNWNYVKCGDKPTLEFIHQNRENEETIKRLRSLKDWYTTNIKDLSPSISRILCQFENCTWDSKLRKKYSFYLITFVVLLFSIMLFIGSFRQLTLIDFFILILIPITPAVMFCCTELKEHIDTNIMTGRIKKEIEIIIESSKKRKFNKSFLKRKSRTLQNEIYERRKRSPLIPDKIYKKLSNTYENELGNWIKEISDNMRSVYKSN